jgi:hypothetical protein
LRRLFSIVTSSISKGEELEQLQSSAVSKSGFGIKSVLSMAKVAADAVERATQGIVGAGGDGGTLLSDWNSMITLSHVEVREFNTEVNDCGKRNYIC